MVKNFNFSISPRVDLGTNNLLRVSNGYWGLFLRDKSGKSVKLTTHLQPVQGSRKRGSIHPLPHTLSCCRASLVKHRDIFTFMGKFNSHGDMATSGFARTPGIGRDSRQCENWEHVNIWGSLSVWFWILAYEYTMKTLVSPCCNR
jgi:hypothetical protein